MKKKKNRKKLNYVFLFIASFLGVITVGSLFLVGVYTYQIATRNGVKGEELPQEWMDQSGVLSTGIEVIPFPGSEDENQDVTKDVKTKDDSSEELGNGVGSKETGEITFAFAGDVMFDDSYSIMNYYRSTGGEVASCFDPVLLETMQGADVFMVNNECTFTKRGEPTPEKTYTFRSNPDNVNILKEMGVDLVSLANNHAYDYGEVSLLDSLATLEGAGVGIVGAGRDSKAAQRPVIYEAGGTKVAILAATQIERMSNPDTKEATEKSPGVFRCFEPDRLCEVIRETKKTVDFVIVYVHWGTENTTEIDWAQRDQAIMFEEAGADLIIGDHPHCLQGMTYINDTPVIYSLGNFWFNSKTVDTGLLQLTVKGDEIKGLSFLPARQQACQTKTLSGEQGKAVLSYLGALSPGVIIDEKGAISKQ